MARARLRLEAFIGELLESVPLVTLGQLVLHIASDDDVQLDSRLAGGTWYHDGVRAFVCELAERLQPELVDGEPGPVDERARAALTVMDWSTVPIEVASELAYRLAYLCRVTPGECFCGYHRSEVCE
jgi:hypothetical protein